jgi:hypothetical protein
MIHPRIDTADLNRLYNLRVANWALGVLWHRIGTGRHFFDAVGTENNVTTWTKYCATYNIREETRIKNTIGLQADRSRWLLCVPVERIACSQRIQASGCGDEYTLKRRFRRDDVIKREIPGRGGR